MRFLHALRKCQNLSCPYGGNTWRALRDRGKGLWFQNRWHCAEECFRQALAESIRHALPGLRAPRVAPRRIPLGVALLSRGLVTETQVKEAVGIQDRQGGQLGFHLRQVAGLEEGQITAALAEQWGCPVHNLSELPRFLRLAGLIPVSLARRYGLVPVRFLRRRRVLKVAFAETLKDEPIEAMEHLLRCRTEPGLADASAVEAALDLLDAQDRPYDASFSGVADEEYVVSEVLRAFEGLKPWRVALTPCGGDLWFRLVSERFSANLVFGSEA